MSLQPVIPGQLPAGFCPAGFQEMLNGFSSHQSVDVSATAGSGIVVSATKPTTGTLPWLRLDQFGRPERVYWFASGAWLSLHPSVPGLTMIWTDVMPNFTIFDGGDALALSAISGPMWEAVTDLAARTPFGAGTLPSGAAIAIGDKSGEEKHVLTAAEMNHYHGIGNGGNSGVDGQWCIRPWAAATVGTGTHSIDTTVPPGIVPALTGGQLGSSDSIASDAASTGHNTLPPYLGVTFLRRTNRLFYAIA